LIVEFIGTTGSGKTTVIDRVHQKLGSSRNVTTSSDLVTGLVGLQGINNTTVRNLLQEIICFPHFLSSYPKYKDFITHTIRMFSRNSNFSIMTINNLRSIERKIGVLEISKRYNKEEIILVDEGPILATHMFAFNDTRISPAEIEKFISLLPLPDLIIYINASLDSLLERSMTRVRPPREMASRNRSENERYLQRAVSLFDQIVESSSIQPRLLIVDNSSNMLGDIDTTANQISEFILNSEQGVN
jgi:deoxyadenosine/deoxycytidine kinase